MSSRDPKEALLFGHFPCKFPVNSEFSPETGSLRTGLTATGFSTFRGNVFTAATRGSSPASTAPRKGRFQHCSFELGERASLRPGETRSAMSGAARSERARQVCDRRRCSRHGWHFLRHQRTCNAPCPCTQVHQP